MANNLNDRLPSIPFPSHTQILKYLFIIMQSANAKQTMLIEKYRSTFD